MYDYFGIPEHLIQAWSNKTLDELFADHALIQKKIDVLMNSESNSILKIMLENLEYIERYIEIRQRKEKLLQEKEKEENANSKNP